MLAKSGIIAGIVLSVMILSGKGLSAMGVDGDTALAITQSTEDASEGSNKQAGESFSGNISWYGTQFHGRKTASGEIFDMHKLTSAHRTLPFGDKVLVEDPRTGESVIVKVNDRGPYVKTRVMDLSKEGARRLGTLNRGIAFVDCLVIGRDKIEK